LGVVVVLGFCDVVVGLLSWGFGRSARVLLTFGLFRVQDEDGCVALRMSRDFRCGLLPRLLVGVCDGFQGGAGLGGGFSLFAQLPWFANGRCSRD
jgi:hypothetical protein